ncbi:hypothetical protein E2L06_16150 [Haloterrigena sp. H1]|uniref:TrmB family transcriptional regulator n=1 Tax=Haloterrigena sp. H1 TaxID=2552943 RepID=UPI00110E6DCF|nr:TrmB family transcriptional regulator [Haloterrigena sp. H1]TMT81503.1 hypothetical protein E2L06_16150 [Haloterrigena sp. H1]
MVPRIASLHKNKVLHIIGGTIGVLAAFVLFTDATLHTIAPVAVIFFTLILHDVIDESYDLPKGSKWIVYGGSIFAAGAYLVVTNLDTWVGGLLALAGLWFIFDGATVIRYESCQAETEHEYVSGLDDETGEVMFRLQTLNVVYQTLEEASEPQTAAEIATARGLTESRAESALGYLKSKGRVEEIGDQYHAKPPRWGKVTPIVEFLMWVPRRIFRPFHRVAASA